MWLKVGENCLSVKKLGSGLGAEFLSVSSRSKLFAYGTMVVLGRLGVKLIEKVTGTEEPNPNCTNLVFLKYMY